jgi:glycosyltransferase involved in cell wall biosynthesis
MTRWAILFSSQALAMSDSLWQSIKIHELYAEKELAVVVLTYNNSAWCIKNIDSILMQKYDNYHVYIIDDCSCDGTYEILNEYLCNHPLNHKVTLRKNVSRQGAAANWYTTIHALPDHVVVVNVDGDDWLAHDQVFVRIHNAYSDRRVWMTFGQFKVWPDGYIGFCRRHASKIIRKQNYRDSEWLSSHLRTYYAWLFKKIKKDDFMYEGSFMPTTCDRAMMYPLLEMCAGHYYCFDEVLYIYNVNNPLADIRKNLVTQQKMCGYITQLPRYKPLADVVVDV